MSGRKSNKDDAVADDDASVHPTKENDNSSNSSSTTIDDNEQEIVDVDAVHVQIAPPIVNTTPPFTETESAALVEPNECHIGDEPVVSQQPTDEQGVTSAPTETEESKTHQTPLEREEEEVGYISSGGLIDNKFDDEITEHQEKKNGNHHHHHHHHDTQPLEKQTNDDDDDDAYVVNIVDVAADNDKRDDDGAFGLSVTHIHDGEFDADGCNPNYDGDTVMMKTDAASPAGLVATTTPSPSHSPYTEEPASSSNSSGSSTFPPIQDSLSTGRETIDIHGGGDEETSRVPPSYGPVSYDHGRQGDVRPTCGTRQASRNIVDDLKGRKKKGSGDCLHRAMRCGAWSFDIFTIIVNLLDVVSDILVAVQFFNAGEKVWGSLVTTSLVLCSIIYTIYTGERVGKHHLDTPYIGRLPRPLRYLIILPFAQLMPTVMWCVETCCSGSGSVLRNANFHRRNTQEMNRWLGVRVGGRHSPSEGGGISNNGPHAFAQAHLGSHVNSATVLGRFQSNFMKHVKSHALFLVETVVESIPQSVIQLLAVTFLGYVTPMQGFSMCLSLVSIISKAYVVSISPIIKAFAFKFLLAAHDVFSLFFIFSTILATERSQDVGIFGSDLRVSTLSAIWMYKVTTIMCLSVIALIIFMINMVAMHSDSARQLGRNLASGIPFFFLGLLLFAPASLAVEGAKLIWFVMLIKRLEPSESQFADIHHMYTFFFSSEDGTSYDDKMHHAIKFIIDERIKRNKGDRTMVMKHVCGRYLPKKSIDDPLTPADLRTIYMGELSVQEFCSTWEDASRRCHHLAGAIFATVCLFSYVISQLFSLIFPILAVASSGWSGLNLLQKICLCATMVCGFLLLVIAIPVWRYFRFLMDLWALQRLNCGGGGNFLSKKMDLIESYYRPKTAVTLLHCCPSEVIPSALLVHDVAPYLADDGPYSILMSGLHVKEAHVINQTGVVYKDLFELVDDMSASSSPTRINKRPTKKPARRPPRSIAASTAAARRRRETADAGTPLEIELTEVSESADSYVSRLSSLQ